MLETTKDQMLKEKIENDEACKVRIKAAVEKVVNNITQRSEKTSKIRCNVIPSRRCLISTIPFKEESRPIKDKNKIIPFRFS